MIRVVPPGFRIPDPDADFLPIPDPGVKKAPDPGSGSTTLLVSTLFLNKSYKKNVVKMTAALQDKLINCT
jgi:hypothetical protein